MTSDYDGNCIDPVGRNITNNSCNVYDIYYNKLDIFRIDSLHKKLQAKKLLSILDIMPFHDYEKTEYYNEFLRKENLYYEIAVPLKIASSTIGGIGIFKQKNEGDFTTKDCEIINYTTRHIASNFKNIMEFEQLKNVDYFQDYIVLVVI